MAKRVRAKSPSLIPIIQSVVTLEEAIVSPVRYSNGTVVPGLYWPSLFEAVYGLDRAISQCVLPKTASKELTKCIDLMKWWIERFRKSVKQYPSFGPDQITQELRDQFVAIDRAFFLTLPMGYFDTEAARQLQSPGTRSTSPLVRDTIAHLRADFPFGPVTASKEAVGYALHPERDERLANGSYQCFHNLVATYSKLPHPPFIIQEGPKRKYLLYFRDAKMMRSIAELVKKYPGRARPSK